MMTAIYWDVITIVLPEPIPIFEEGGEQLVNSSVSFRVDGNSSISTLSYRAPFAPDGIIQGLFYVPDLNASDPCAEFSSQYLPQNVTRKANIPNVDQYALIGVAPWINDRPECAFSYIQASKADATRGLFFFPTSPDASITTPVWENPEWGVNRARWGDWVRGTDYSIWGIPPDIGATVVQEMGKYSGNVSTAPFASELAQAYAPGDAVRLFSQVTLNTSRDSNPVLGRLWVFAIMILAILCFVTGMTSLVMHLNQRRLRRDLRRRIAAGEVDLEILGIKRQRVPQNLLDKMPLYVYTSKLAPSTPLAKGKKDEKQPATSFQLMSTAQRKMLPIRDVPFAQTTCPICLDDFEHNETIVRELPCQHIFHPECVDEFLRLQSSLCPVCKSSALPVGYCPEKITVAMVRRERMIRRMREDGTGPPPLANRLPASVQRILPGWLLRVRPRPRQAVEQPHRRSNRPSATQRQRLSSIPNATTSPHPTAPSTDLEMGTLPPPPNPTTTSTQPQIHPSTPLPPSTRPHTETLEDLPPEIQALSPEERREWGRQRLAATLPAAPAPGEEEIQAQQLPGWKRAWRKLFPS